MQSLKHSINAMPKTELDHDKLELAIEAIASTGCIMVNKLLYSLNNQQIPEQLSNYSPAERDFIYHELKSIMAVYEGGICHL